MGDASHLERMGRELKCPICLSLLNSAVSLSCNHLFCNACIQKSMKSASDCPVCKIPYRRREVRPAPHMDNLVNIYKSMEVASGVNIFVTQNATSPKLSGEQHQSKADKICAVEEVYRMCNDTPNRQNQKRVKGKLSKRSSKFNLSSSNSNPIKPSFPTKKRVQVTQYPPPETPTQPGKFGDEMGNNANEIPQKKPFLEKAKLVLNGMGDSTFSPFFWLRDEEDAEKLSQQTDGDHFTDTPPAAPCFSDIKDSDDEVPNQEIPNRKNSCALTKTDMFDSEMFDWTQRACSPELCSSPLKMQVEEIDEYDGFQEKDHRSDSVNKTMNEELKGVIDRKGAINVDSLCGLSSPKAEDGDNEDCTRKSKRGRKANISSRKKGAKRLTNDLLQVHIDSQKEAEDTSQGKGCKTVGGSSTSRKKVCRRTKVGFDSAAAKQMPEKISGLSVGEDPIAQEGKNKVTGLLFSSNPKESKEFGSLEKMGQSCEVVSKQKIDDAKRSIPEVPSSVKNNLTAIQGMPSQPPNTSISRSDGKKISNSCVKSRKGEDKKTAQRKCGGRLRCQKKVKFAKNDCSCGKLSNKNQGIHDEFGEENTQPSGKIQGNSNSEHMDDLSNMKDFPDSANGTILYRCNSIHNKVQCAFCHSTEDSEASGEMAHYLKGKPVSADDAGGSNILHVHKQCAEWAPDVYFEDDNVINLEAEIARGRRIKCSLCGIKGAALGCYEKSCRKSFHVPCAKLTPQCRWDNDNFVLLCPLHASLKFPHETSPSQAKLKNKSNTKRRLLSQPSQVMVKHDKRTNSLWKSLGSSQKLVLCCSALTDAEKETVSEFEKLSGVTVLKNWSSCVTHVIASTDENGACRRTLKFLMAILEGKWILSIEWVKASMKAMQPVDEQRYEIEVDIHGIRGGPRLGRIRVSGQQPKIFNGYKFFLAGKFEDSYKGYLQDLVIAAGGTVLHRKPVSGDKESLSSGRFTAPTFIIYSLELPEKCNPSDRYSTSDNKQSAEALANSTGAWVASSAWVMNSIAACKLQDLSE